MTGCDIIKLRNQKRRERKKKKKKAAEHNNMEQPHLKKMKTTDFPGNGQVL